MFTPREYQEYAIQSVFAYFSAGNTGNPIVVVPTGCGKSVIAADFIKRVVMAWPQQRIMLLSHVKEILVQNEKALLRQWPTVPLGMYSAGLKRKDTDCPITFAGIASVAKKPELFGHIDLLLIDECHLVSDKSTTMYCAFIDALKKVNKHLKVVGFTATPYRLKNGLLTEGKIFTDTCCDMTTPDAFSYFVENGYMAPLITKRTSMEYDTSNVPIRGGEFALKQLQEEVNKTELTRAAVEEMIEVGSDRNSWLIFTTGIQHAEDTARMLNRRGIKAAAVHSKLTSAERDARISAFKNAEYRAITNQNVMTTGFDHPPIDLIGMLRPTQSASLWCQALGRGTRPFSGDDLFPAKKDCISEGQLILTDQGEVPIEQVTTKHRLWDGIEWVNHSGVIYKGEKEVMCYAGLTATPEHKVWTEKGWSPLWRCAVEQTPIKVAGIAGVPQFEHRGYIRCSHTKRQGSKSALYDEVRIVRKGRAESALNSNKRYSWLSKMWQKAKCRQACIGRTSMANTTLHSSKAALYKPKGSKLCCVWRSRNTLPFQIPFRDWSVFNGQCSKLYTRHADRPQREQRTLHSRKSKDGQSCRERKQSTPQLCNKKHAPLSKTIPVYNIRRQHADKPNRVWIDGRRNNREVPQTKHQTKRKVWDILNAGPRNRFTCQGLIVSNCLVLDFAGNTRRLGPIDDPVIPKKKRKGKGGQAPVKVCEKCSFYNHASAKVCCQCGHEFHVNNKMHMTADTAAVMRLKKEKPVPKPKKEPIIEVFRVDHAVFKKHQKVGKPVSLKVTYHCGLRRFSEWVCLEHEGWPLRRARQWWKRLSKEAIPITVDEALSKSDSINPPKAIRVDVSKKYPQVLEYLKA